ncbi:MULTISPECIES: MFS transporter [unclassified Pseudomonas]|uniref:MFS transporter n=1 Tax=unclassified Pseudomonas TaxID=196821 RepID=UPI00119B5E76|nr:MULTISPECIES: MFS transporter [unclassified Pseudomonas]TWC16588.1 DHA1 family bicyclomycin/chloramphenicol resistance-like MFS transporter [Pseudomonas sp. SJZ074]TWC17888.1 DHA1 family bicyclomycin/chloramphenicol resistance-like MFS transporter [Pseudomonas sp. SJZ075]TWC34164.1 DHA1 family bicyclomycin/chloramphenicol resistance-like MFS transporter [Pseudomonas sp. SJZ078]TWC34954.1 DHA1 family bicyclomycin/chloramphenicol resistance-like MFS transporter [Pseudomonas sp. SJZ085]TWC5505
MDEPKNLPGRKPATVGLLLTMTLLGVFPIDVVLPSFPALSEHFGRSSSDIALSVSLFAIGIALSQLLVGPLSDTMGRKNLLLIGITVSAVGAMGCVLTDDYGAFLFFRVVQALGCGCFVLSQALIQDLFTGLEQQRLRIFLVTCGGIFISVSPLAGTGLQHWMGWRGSFLVFIALAIGVFASARVLLSNAMAGSNPRRLDFIGAYRTVCSDFCFMAYWLTSALAFSCHFSFIVISPLVFIDQLQLSPEAFSLALLGYGLAYIGGGALATVLSNRIDSQTQIVTGLSLILLAGVLMFGLSSYFGLSVSTVLLPMIVCTAGTTIARAAAHTRAMNLFPEQAGTSASAGSVLIFIVGGLTSAAISLTPLDLQTTLAACLVLLSLLGLALNGLIRHRRQGLLTG